MSILDVTDVRDYLNIPNSASDTKLQSVLDSAEAAIAQKCGPLTATAVTARVEGGCVYSLRLPVSPAISLTTVTPYNSGALTIGDLHLDTSSATVTRNDGGLFIARYYDITYQAGRASVPNDLKYAIKELVRDLWTPQRGGARRPGTAPDEQLSNSLPNANIALPFRIARMVAPYTQLGI